MIHSTTCVTKRTPLARHAMVAAEHPLAARVGAQILERGGNAVDAAVATAFALPVVEPFMSTLAGSGVMTVYLAKKDLRAVVDFNVCAPRAADESTFAVVGGAANTIFPWPRVRGDDNVLGHRAVAVPGTVAGLCRALELYGTMELADAMAPAIALAKGGYVADWYQALHTARSLEELSRNPAAAATYLKNGRAIPRPPSIVAGDRVSFPELADSLEQIARHGSDVFYRGALGQAMVDELAAHGGLITMQDLRDYQVRIGPPLQGRYRDLELLVPPGATGGVSVLQVLNALAELRPGEVAFGSGAGWHRKARAIGEVFAERLRDLANDDQLEAVCARMLSASRARELGSALRSAGHSAGPAAARQTDDCTTHVSVIDRDRNMVALSNTAASLWGACVVVPGTGILLNNGMVWFDPEPGKANSVAPAKRALVNMAPTLGLRDGSPQMALGATGGRRIISALVQVISNLADAQQGAQQAIEAPRLHAEGGKIAVSDRCPAPWVQALEAGGLQVELQQESCLLGFGRPVMVNVLSTGLEAGLEQFSAAAAAGY